MATLATELWPGAAAAAIPAQWTVGTQTGTAQQDGAAHATLTTAAVAYSTTKTLYLSGMAAAADVDLLGDYLPDALVEEYVCVGVRGDGTFGTGSGVVWPANGYVLGMVPNMATMSVNRCVAGTQTQLTTFAWTWTASQRISFRLRVIGAVVSVRVWAYGTTEPGTWNYTGTDATPYATAGKASLSFASGAVASARVASFGALTVTTDGTTTGGGTVAYTSGTPTTLSTTRTTSDISADHAADHNVVHAAVNDLTTLRSLASRLAVNATTTSTTVVDITGLVPVAVPIGTYAVDFYGLWQASAVTASGGVRLAVGGTATASSVAGRAEIAVAAGSLGVASVLTALNTLTAVATAGAAATTYVCTVHATIVVSAAGTLGVRWGTGAAVTDTLLAGSYLILTRIA